MDYIFVQEAADKWNVTIRQVQRLLHAGRIFGAKKQGIVWLIPEDAVKPKDPRTSKIHYQYLPTILYFKGKKAMREVPEVYSEIANADLAYRMGNAEPAKEIWRLADPSNEKFITTAVLATVAAISSGDYPLYHEIQQCVRNLKAKTDDARDIALLSLPETLAAVSMVLPEMTPEWLKKADFSLYPESLASFLLNLYTLHLRNQKDHAGVLMTARASLVLCEKRDSFTWIDLNNHVLCAQANYSLGNITAARSSLMSAMKLGLPYGMITPFADVLGSMGNLMEECLNTAYPEYVKPIQKQWEVGFKNWMNFHNLYTKESITTLLNPREYQTAYLIANGESYAVAARHMNLSVGRFKNILAGVYEKLGISKKEQLKDYIL